MHFTRLSGPYDRADPELRVLYVGALFGCPGTLPIIPPESFTAPRNCFSDNALTVVDKLEKYDNECTIGVAIQLMQSAESITFTSAKHKQREINALSYIKEGSALQYILHSSQADKSSPRHEISLIAATRLTKALPRKCMRILLGGSQGLDATSGLKIRLLSYCGEVGLSEMFDLYTRSASVPEDTLVSLIRIVGSLSMESMDAPMISALVALAQAASKSENTAAQFLDSLMTMLSAWRGSSDDSKDVDTCCGDVVEPLITGAPQLFARPRLWMACLDLLNENVSDLSLEEVRSLDPLLTTRIGRFQPAIRKELLLLEKADKLCCEGRDLLTIGDNFVTIGGGIQGSRRMILGLAERFKSEAEDSVVRKVCRHLVAAMGLSIAAPRELRLAATSYAVTEQIDTILPARLAEGWQHTISTNVMCNIDHMIDYLGKCLICGDIFPASEDPNIHQLVEDMFSAHCCVPY